MGGGGGGMGGGGMMGGGGDGGGGMGGMGGMMGMMGGGSGGGGSGDPNDLFNSAVSNYTYGLVNFGQGKDKTPPKPTALPPDPGPLYTMPTQSLETTRLYQSNPSGYDTLFDLMRIFQ